MQEDHNKIKFMLNKPFIETTLEEEIHYFIILKKKLQFGEEKV